MAQNLSIKETVRKLPRELRGIAFEDVKSAVLGERYELSLVFTGSSLSRRLNREKRGKDKPANVLSFPLSEESGEIFIDVRRAKSEHAKFGEGYSTYVLRLFIHGLLHLKGMDHGDTMDKAEIKFLRKFNLTKK